jgi:hypothetical protein
LFAQAIVDKRTLAVKLLWTSVFRDNSVEMLVTSLFAITDTSICVMKVVECVGPNFPVFLNVSGTGGGGGITISAS